MPKEREMKVMLAGRWAKAHAMAKAIAANPDTELIAAMDRRNPGISAVADRTLILDITDPAELADAAQSESVEAGTGDARLLRKRHGPDTVSEDTPGRFRNRKTEQRIREVTDASHDCLRAARSD